VKEIKEFIIAVIIDLQEAINDKTYTYDE